MTHELAKKQPSYSAGQRAILHLFEEYERVQNERNDANVRLARFNETIQLLMKSLPENEQSELVARFENIQQGKVTISRGGETYKNVISLFRLDRRPEWAIQEVQEELEKKGTAPETKALYNTISYLAKIGRLKRVGRGRYVIVDVGVGIETEGYDSGVDRITEHDL
ncbi:MAG: hypothetical protein ABJM26_10795 [Anderseniella sp.]